MWLWLVSICGTFLNHTRAGGGGARGGVACGIFTIGHSTHELESFVSLLGRHGVELLVDVRAHPGSRRVPWTSCAELAGSLAVRGIAYEDVPELRGRRRAPPDSPDGGWQNEQFRGYADHMQTPEFQGALRRLLDEQRRTALMCAEAQWWRCHRRLVADALLAHGVEVLHIDARGGTAAHELTEFAVVEGTSVVYPPAQEALEL